VLTPAAAARGPPGNTWANWVLVGACGLSCLAIAVFPERYARTKIDTAAGPATVE
jgi:hypothetical protein